MELRYNRGKGGFRWHVQTILDGLAICGYRPKNGWVYEPQAKNPSVLCRDCQRMTPEYTAPRQQGVD